MYPFAKIHVNCKVNSPLYKVPKKPFFHVSTKISVARNFLDAMTNLDFIKATSYISREIKDPLQTISLVGDFLEDGVWEYKWLIKLSYSSENINTQSILVIHEKKTNDILHLHLVKEPDIFSTWKINKIEQE